MSDKPELKSEAPVPVTPAGADWPTRRAALLRRARELPAKPGVYTFFDARRKPIYIGKAVNLRARVSSYFREGADDGRAFFPYIVTSTRDLAFLVVDSDKEALLLENSLIKQQKPRFNILLTDDKSHLSIKVSVDEAWPRVLLVRRPKRDKGQYFGPFASASEARELARLIKRHFPLRTCSNAEFRQRTRPCIEHQMGRCGAPCVGREDEEDYNKTVEDVLLFLKGRNDELLPRLEERMKAHAARLEFEAAARVRDELKAVRNLSRPRTVSRSSVFTDQDAFGVAQVGGTTVVRVLHVRRGQVSGSTDEVFATRMPQDAVLNAFLGQFYDGRRPVPDEVLLPFALEDEALYAEVLTEQSGRKVKLSVPQRGSRAALLAMAVKNAAAFLNTDSERKKAMQATLTALQDGLNLPAYPQVIECYDISTIQGAFTVASMVRFVDGEPRRDQFRKFKINSVEGQDDFASMKEVISRRFAPARAHRHGSIPDLVVIDGGKGQLGVAEMTLRALGYLPNQLTVVGLAKARKKGPVASQERVFFPRRKEPVVLLQDTPELRMLARIRDAAHEHAITYHRQVRRKRFLKTGLEEVPGVGPGRRKALLKHFGNLKAIKEASLEQLKAVKGVPSSVAETVYEFFR